MLQLSSSSTVNGGVALTTTSMLASLKLFKVPVLTFLATIGFLSVNVCTPINELERLQEHRWRQRDNHYHSSNLKRLPSSYRDWHDFHSLDLCSRCPPGFGVVRRCSLIQDTVCHSCPSGYYAPTFSRKHACWPCSLCGDGLYEAHPCTVTSDTICDACLNQLPATTPPLRRGQRQLAENLDPKHEMWLLEANADYQRKCAFQFQVVEDNLRRPSNFSSTFPNSLRENKGTNEDDEAAIGVAQLAYFQVVLIFSTVALLLALTCRLRVFSNPEPAHLKQIKESGLDDGIALIEHLSAP